MVPRTRLAALSLLPLWASVPSAQESHDGWILVSTARTTEFPSPSNPFLGNGGLWLVHPRIPGTPVAVTGLGSDLTGAGVGGPLFAHGANCVLRLPDETVLVGEAGLGVPIDLHVLTLDGASMVSDAQIACGVAGTDGEGGGINQLAVLPDGRVLMAVFGIASGPLAGADLGLADLVAGTVSPVTVVGITGVLNALALDEAGTTAYVGTTFGDVFSLPVPAGGTAAYIASFSSTSIMNLARDNDGDLLVGCFFEDLFKLDPDTGSATPLGLPTMVYNALTIERVTGNHVVVQHDPDGFFPPTCWVAMEAGGVVTPPLAIPPLGGWGVMTGLDLNPNPEVFGPASPGANTYEWSLAPSPGGLPLVGSSTFGLELVSSPGVAPGLLLVSQDDLDSPIDILGALLLVDPFQAVASDNLAPAGVQFLSLKIPPVPGLVGLDFFAQAGFLEPGGVAASQGVKLTIL